MYKQELKRTYPEEAVNGGIENYIENVKEVFLEEQGNLYDWQKILG